MLSIKSVSKELTKVERYLMTQSQDMTMLQNVEDGTAIEVAAFCQYEDYKEDKEETVSLLSILTPDNRVFVTQSATFTRSFRDIADVFHDDDGYEPFTIIKLSGKTNAGRPFINCALDVR